jgi:glycosyltransferase involved in cell wall biosynthesis
MRMAYISGDGLAVSGVLTIFRNVAELGHDLGAVEYPVTADLGYSWRPDKAPFYPDGAAGTGYPDWLRVSSAVPAGRAPGLADEWLALRSDIACEPELEPGRRAGLPGRIEALARPYEDYFADWFDREDIDWAVAANMTLSDAVPVTVALHRVAERRWGSGRPGGVLFWDHDLFRSYAVYEGEERVYPPVPSQLTPVPQAVPYHRWIVPTADLAAEAAGYPTDLTPQVIPYLLPDIPAAAPGHFTGAEAEFLAQQQIPPGTPVVVAPVRVFRVKGAEIAVEVIAEARREAARRGDPLPCLLVFGSLDEDPDYARVVLATLAASGDPGGVRFLGGVPLASYRDPAGQVHLDEISLLRIAVASRGALCYTPNRADVESVGLGPALAAAAGLPFATTGYNALAEAYGPGLEYVHVTPGQPAAGPGAELAGWLAGFRAGDPAVAAALEGNRTVIARRFPAEPTQRLLRAMAATAAVTA